MLDIKLLWRGERVGTLRLAHDPAFRPMFLSVLEGIIGGRRWSIGYAMVYEGAHVELSLPLLNRSTVREGDAEEFAEGTVYLSHLFARALRGHFSGPDASGYVDFDGDVIRVVVDNYRGMLDLRLNPQTDFRGPISVGVIEEGQVIFDTPVGQSFRGRIVPHATDHNYPDEPEDPWTALWAALLREIGDSGRWGREIFRLSPRLQPFENVDVAATGDLGWMFTHSAGSRILPTASPPGRGLLDWPCRPKNTYTKRGGHSLQ